MNEQQNDDLDNLLEESRTREIANNNFNKSRAFVLVSIENSNDIYNDCWWSNTVDKLALCSMLQSTIEMLLDSTELEDK